MKHVIGAAAALAFAAGLAGPAFAHAHLLSATPAADSTVSAAPTQLELHFSEALELAFTGVTLTSTDKDAVPLGEESLEQGDNKVLVVPIARPLRPGAYTVVWHALSIDGHKTSGQYEFTVEAK